jgi:hypothetical protein
MASFTPLSRTLEPLTSRPFITALIALLIAFLGLPVRAEGIELIQFNSQRSEDGLELSFSTRFELTPPVEDALHKGVPLYFVAETTVFRKRWYWRDSRVGRAERVWRLAWQPLTRQYRVSTGGLNQSFSQLEEALASLRGVSNWPIAEAKEIEGDGRYYLEFSFRLDVSQLPRPMQIGLSSVPGFALGVEQKRPLNADFSLK